MGLREFVEDKIIRRKAMFERIPVERFSIRLARTVEEYEQAFRLVHVAYVYQGYELLKAIDMRTTEQHVLPEASVLVAYEDGRCVGTISATLDSPAGLPLDKDYPEELGALRSQGARIVEIGSFAVVSRARRTGASQLLALSTFRLGERAHGATHYVIGVNPKAAPFYRAVWGFKPLGPSRGHADLSAPVVGLVVSREQGLACMRRFGRMRDGFLPSDYPERADSPPGLQLPEHLPPESWTRWKMPREVFRELFIRRSNRLHCLSEQTRGHLRTQRSDGTVRQLQLKAV